MPTRPTPRPTSRVPAVPKRSTFVVDGFTTEDLEVFHTMLRERIELKETRVGEILDERNRMTREHEAVLTELKRLRLLVDRLEDAGIGLDEDDGD